MRKRRKHLQTAWIQSCCTLAYLTIMKIISVRILGCSLYYFGSIRATRVTNHTVLKKEIVLHASILAPCPPLFAEMSYPMPHHSDLPQVAILTPWPPSLTCSSLSAISPFNQTGSQFAIISPSFSQVCLSYLFSLSLLRI